jgi:phage replication-related protein YjqB (UPF0714/DUF867 family)
MPDKYPNFESLRQHKAEGRDYRIIVRHESRSRSTIIVAPHAGKIEPVTSMLAKEIAGDDYCLYLFEGILDGNNFPELHITSTNFDEPQALRIVGECMTVVAIHGRRDEGDPNTILLGGRHIEMVTSIESRLRSEGFRTSSNGHRYPADNPQNICNRGLTGRGTQLEVPNTLRQRMRATEPLRQRFVKAVREALERPAS